MKAKIPVFLSGALWVLTMIHYTIKLVFYTTGAVINREPTVHSDVTRIEVHCDNSIRVFPGSYFYVFLPGKFLHYNMLASYPMTVMWYAPENVSDANEVTDVAFLISHRSRALRSMRFSRGQRLLLDGPYGQDLGLQHFETVMLAAKGIGILGILPLALNLFKRQVRGDSCPKVNIFWALEEIPQENWVMEELKTLQAMDLSNVTAPCATS
jgi:NAD(P)H-flavin reductase